MAKTFTKSEKNYIRGTAKTRTFDNGGEVLDLNLNLADLNALPVSPTGYINIRVAARKDVGKYGETHSVYENTFKPEAKGAGPSKPAGKPASRAPGGFGGAKSDNLPF